ncbi:MAG: DUF5719 family protein [Ilumatobacteraceae bacterium]
MRRISIRRRSVLLVAVVALPAVGAGAALATRGGTAELPMFASPAAPSPPYVPARELLSATWFCAGVPMVDRGVGDRGLGGVVVVANPGDTPLDALVTVFTTEEGVLPIEQEVQVDARSTAELNLATVQPDGEYVAAMVEIAGGGGFVEQRADHADGSAVSPCSNSTSDEWFLADNYTLNDSNEDLVIVNPYPDFAIVDITFASRDARRSPQELQGMPIPGRSIRVVSEEFMPKDEAILAADVRASQGRIVVARAQRYVGERRGFSLTLAAPAASPEWWFADGEKSEAVAFERYSIYNPGERDVTVDVAVLGITDAPDEFVPIRSDVVPAGQVVSFTTKEFENMPDGRHYLTFSTQSEAGIVVERGITRKVGDSGVVTAVSLGAPQVFLGYMRWSMAIGATVPVSQMLIVANLDFVDATVTVKSIGPGGEQPIPGLEDIVLSASGVIAIDIPDDVAALGLPLIVESTSRIIVERSLPRADDRLGRSGSLAMPG